MEKRSRPRSIALSLLLILILLLALGCQGGRQPPAGATAANTANTAAGPVPEWVTVHQPRLAWPGYTLTLHEGRVPVLLDMNGREVHRWPEARIKSRVLLLPDGSILGIGLGRQVVEYDWEGRQTWTFPTPGAIPHHDLLRLANGHTLVLVLRDGDGADVLYEVDRAGKVAWSWVAPERLGALLGPPAAHPGDVTHINSLQELPDNPWHRAGDRRFRPGNLLLSARNLNLLFMIDRQSGEVVWHHTADLDRQHEARMNGPGLPNPGNILVFNNRLGSFWGDHRSELQEIDPRDGAVRWRYRSAGFFSPTNGVQQALPNGNVLITSTRGGRVFEVTRGGQIAWEWVPPYEPGRALRVAADACPQLARLARPAPAAVVPPAGYRHVDPDAYRFARQGSRMQAVVGGEQRTVLKEENDCRQLTLPAAARVQVGYGIDRDRLQAAGRAARPPEFILRLRPAPAAAPANTAAADRELLRDRVGLEGPAWRQRTIPLDAYGLRTVELCVEIEIAGGSPGRKRDRFAYWEQPYIAPPRHPGGPGRPGEADDDDAARAPAPGDLTPEELEVRRQHLKALGYIN